MKIVEFTDSFIPITDGVGNVVYQYALSLAKMGHEVYVVAPQTDTGFRGSMPFEIIDYIGFNINNLKNYRAGIPSLDSNCHSRLKMINADVVHVHTPFTAGQAGLAYAKERRLPVVGTFHSNYYEDIFQLTGLEILAAAGAKIIAGFYNKCDEVWAVSAKSSSTLRKYGCNKHICIMENGTDIAIPNEELKNEIRNKYGLTHIPVLLYVGQMNWKKNIKCILSAVSMLESEYRLVMVGAGPHEREIRKMTVKLGIAKKTIFTGFIRDEEYKNALFGIADLFVFPSLYDTSGLVVKEAAAAGTPSVTVIDSGASEGIKSGENGFLCDNAAEDLARVIKTVLADKKLLKQVGISAKLTIPISWKKITEMVVERYADLSENNPHLNGRKELNPND